MHIHRPILSAAWRLALSRKKLWIFGFFALLVFVGGEYQIINQSLSDSLGANIYDRLLANNSIPSELWPSLLSALSVDWATSLAVILLILLVGGLLFLVLWLSVKSQIALINWTKKDRLGETKEEISLWEAFTKKDGCFWRVLATSVFIEIAIFAASVFLSIPLIFLYFQDSLWAVATYTLFFLILIPTILSLSLLAKYAMAEIVLEKKGFTASIIKAWSLFKNNWLVSLEMALILFFINFTVSLITIFILTFIALPIMLTLMLFGLSAPLAILVLLSFLFLALVASFLMTFQTAAWTNLYLEIKDHSVVAKIERLLKSKPKKVKSSVKTKAAIVPKKIISKTVSKKTQSKAKKTNSKKNS
ncbi:hypothetical protein EOL72_01145 [Candidatus Falkowbacteria bacterium]|nr:hypothetical protein [Patescibacteria group bacterium]NCU42944.1 hypothetical protein [Candidatus Falkowbacteria bacterium]